MARAENRQTDIPLNIEGSEIIIQRLEGYTTKEIDLKKKVVSREELEELGQFYRKRGQTISFTTGVFDMIHIGHARYLDLAKSLGNILVAGLNSDTSVKELKGPGRPILPDTYRSEMLYFLEAVDYITVFPETNGAKVIEILKPDCYLCVEGSWEGDISTKEEVIAMAKNNGKVFFTPRQEPHLSTSEIIARIENSHGQKLLQKFSDFISQSSE